MKHALLITAYKDFAGLETLVNQFNDSFTIYIHIDKRSKINSNILQRISEKKNVKHLAKTYAIKWGGLNHLKAYLFLSKKALKNKENKYFHLITGQDFPVKSNAFFNDLLFNKNEHEINYLEYFPMPATIWWKDGGMGRLTYYNFYNRFNAKTPWGEKCLKTIKTLQVNLKIKRPINIKEKLYGGSTYWTLSRNILQYVIDFTANNPSFFKRFKYTFCAEEIYFQTVIMNSTHAKNITNDNLRFIDWEKSEDGSPAFLETTNYDSIINSNKLFARKIKSEKLQEMLIRNREK